MADNMGEGINGWGLGGTIGGVGGGVGEQKVDRRDRWGQVVRNSSVVGMSSSRFNEELNL